ncbi:MAG TPA: response regulator [Ferruginibacter sp.]|jgi:DNA-binding response OmpR family regulator|nr:response regulator [Ferruginibacter sp.]
MARILIVEDYLDLVNFFSVFLEREGFEVKGISSTKGIESNINHFNPDLVLLDVMFGIGICKEIKQMNKAIPIILMSTNPKLLENYIEYNADDIIEKPFDNDEVLNKINNILIPASKRA